MISFWISCGVVHSEKLRESGKNVAAFLLSMGIALMLISSMLLLLTRDLYLQFHH